MDEIMRGLTWEREQWHCEGRPIETGAAMQLKSRWSWLDVRIEFFHQGREIVAVCELDGLTFQRKLDSRDQLRWP